VLAVPRQAGVARFDALSAGFSAVLELPVDKRQLFNVLHSVSAGEEVRDGVVRLQDYAHRGATKRLDILVADDNPTNREVLGKILERGGHAVTLVNDGEQALDAVERARYDVVLLDRNMPGINGIEALQAIRLMTRGRERLPVVMLSADVTPEARREAIESGADTFLSKPIEAVRLLEEVRRLALFSEEARKAPAAGSRAARQATTTEAVVNIDTLRHLEELGSSPKFMERLIGVFLADSAGLISRVEQSLAARDYGEFRAIVHAMKGSSASIGTDRLTRLCGNFGALSDSELRLQGPGLLRSLGAELQGVRTELERYLEERQRSAG